MLDKPKKSLAAIKSDVCDTTIVVMSWLSIPALMASVSRVLESGWTLQHSAQVAAVAISWVVSLSRKRLPYAVRANMVLGLLFWLGWTGQIFTAANTSFVFFVSASAMAAVFYGTRGGVAAVVLSLVISFSTYLAFVFGALPEPSYVGGLGFTTWLSRAASIVISAAGPVIAISQFRRSLIEELARSEASSEAKSGFLAMMSHELRTPMTAVIGIAELLQQDQMTAAQAQKVDRIASAGKNLLALLNDVLDFAKLEAEQMGIDKTPFSLRDVLNNVRDLFTPLAEEKNLFILIEEPSGEDVVVGDAARIRQILQNLVGNAIKFTEHGYVSIAMRQTPLETSGLGPKGIQLTINVSDSGIGISSADYGRLFQPFVQSENFRTRSRGGTGLGLAISRRLAGLMQGDLSVTSELGKGSTFTLTLPVKIAAKESLTRAGLSGRLGPAHRPLHILLAEDNVAIRDLTREMITNRRHTVDCVVNGLEALKAVQVTAYDVIVMDMHMPVMDGSEATQAIRKLDGPASKIPIIALTAGLTERQRAAYMEAGVDQIVAKPPHWPTLFDAIETHGLAADVPSGLTPSPPPPPILEPLNAATLTALEGDVGGVALARMLVTFRASVSQYDDQLQAALKNKDLAAAKRAGHGLKGTCRQFGASELAEIGAAIEHAGATRDDLLSDVTKIAPALTRLDAALSARAQTANA